MAALSNIIITTNINKNETCLIYKQLPEYRELCDIDRIGGVCYSGNVLAEWPGCRRKDKKCWNRVNENIKILIK